MPYFTATRERENVQAQWHIQSDQPIRTKKDAHLELDGLTVDETQHHAIFNLSELRQLDQAQLLANPIPKARKLDIPNAAWLMDHATPDDNERVINNIAIIDIPKRGRYAVATNGWAMVAQPTTLPLGMHPGKTGKLCAPDTKYPNVAAILPTRIKSSVTIDIGWLYRGLKRAGVFARESADRVHIQIQPDTRTESDTLDHTMLGNSDLILTANARNIGDMRELIPCYVEGEASYFNVSYAMLMRILKGWKAHTARPTYEQVIISVSHNGPLLIEPRRPPIVSATDERLPFAMLMTMSKTFSSDPWHDKYSQDRTNPTVSEAMTAADRGKERKAALTRMKSEEQHQAAINLAHAKKMVTGKNFEHGQQEHIMLDAETVFIMGETEMDMMIITSNPMPKDYTNKHTYHYQVSYYLTQHNRFTQPKSRVFRMKTWDMVQLRIDSYLASNPTNLVWKV